MASKNRIGVGLMFSTDGKLVLCSDGAILWNTPEAGTGTTINRSPHLKDNDAGVVIEQIDGYYRVRVLTCLGIGWVSMAMLKSL